MRIFFHVFSMAMFFPPFHPLILTSSFLPSFLSSFHPSTHPSVLPSFLISFLPSIHLSNHPSVRPSCFPSVFPSFLSFFLPSFLSCLSLPYLLPSFHIVPILFSLFLIFPAIPSLLPFLSQSHFSYMALLLLSFYRIYHFPCYIYLTPNVAFLYLGDIPSICTISECPIF